MPLRLMNQEIPAAAAAVSAVLASQQAPGETVDPQQATELRKQVRSAQENHRLRRDELRGLYEVIAKRRAELEAARADGRTTDLPGLEMKLQEVLGIRDQQLEKIRLAAEQVHTAQRNLVNGLGTAAAWSHLTADTPIALLPVRLETRYVAADAEHYELLVRIFPDDIHLDGHQPLMTFAENQDGRSYWETRLKDGPDADTTRVQWHAICERHGEPRAMWIAAQLDPYKRGGLFQAGDGGPSAPPIPSVPVAPPEWLEPAQMRALPDRWAIVGYRGEHRILLHWTKPVPPELRVTPELGAPGSELEAKQDDLDLSAGIEWLTDFTAAEAVGMAARIRVRKLIARSMDRLMVFGISAARTRQEATAELNRLLGAHAATGLGFVPPGTPTNNMESERTEVRSRQHEHNESHQRFLESNPGKDPGSHGARLAANLGLNTNVFRTAPHAMERLEKPVEALHTALWPTTWGSVLENQVEADISPETLEFARNHFIRHVRGLGPLPALRVGAQPYGVLPVTSLDLWKAPPAGDPTRAAQIPEPTEPSAGSIFVNLLRSIRNYCRRAYSEQFIRSFNFIPHVPDSRDPQREMVSAMAMDPSAHVVRAQTVVPVPSQVDAVNTAMTNWWQAALSALASGPIDLRGQHGGAQLSTRRNAADMWFFHTERPLVSGQPDSTAPLADNYLAAFAARPNAQAVRDHQIAGGTEKSLLYLLLRSAYLILADGGGDTAAFAASVGAVQNLPVGTLEMLVSEVIDLCTYRVDAWMSSIANERLEPSGGVYLGGFGWSEGLQPPGEAIAADGAVHEDPDSAGFIHMPSTQQAKSAAVLYGGHLSHAEQGSGETLSLNLESDRVRTARWLIDGQRQGQSLSALLGYRFERSLVDGGDAQYIASIRMAFPLAVGQTTTNGTEVAAANVVDGLELHTRWRAGQLGQVLSGGVLNIAMKHAPVLDDALDALSDLLVAEGVHQATNGNPTRAAAAFDALAEGETLQTDPDVIATPAAGQQVAHCVMVVLPEIAPPGWSGDSQRPRAAAEPRLNGWAATVLGAPSGIRFRAAFAIPEQEPVVRDFTLAELDLCPLDVVYLAGERAAEAPLAELIRHRLTQLGSDGQGAPFEKLTLLPERYDSQPERTSSLEEALGVAWAMKRLLADARALAAEDLQLATAAPAPGTIHGAVLAELEARVIAARQRVDAIRTAYSQNPTPENWWRASALTGPVDPKSDDGPAALLAALQKRIADADAVVETDLGRAALARLAALLGKEFRVLPQVQPANGSALAAAVANQDVLLESDETRPPRWLHDYGRVRPACETLDLLLMLSHAMQRPAKLTVGQLPVIPGQVWIGDRLPANGAAPRLSLVAHIPSPAPFTGKVAGLMVDSWSEVVPTARVTTGVTFNYDEPKAQAPQTLLLAVPPDPARGWDFQSLEAALLETFELAKIRGLVAEELSDSDSPVGYLEFYRPALHLSSDQRPELEAAAQGA